MPLKHQNAFYLKYLFSYLGKVSILKKFETENDGTTTSEEIIEAGLKLLMKRYQNLTKFVKQDLKFFVWFLFYALKLD